MAIYTLAHHVHNLHKSRSTEFFVPSLSLSPIFATDSIKSSVFSFRKCAAILLYCGNRDFKPVIIVASGVAVNMREHDRSHVPLLAGAQRFCLRATVLSP
jgi:hypothetical protein